MPDVYNAPTIYEFPIIGAASTGLTVKRHTIPFDYEIVGVTATANTAPTTTSMILDIVAGPNNTAPASLVSVWPLNNGQGTQSVTQGGTVSGGTYTLTYNSLTTAAIAFGALPAAVLTALQTALIPAVSTTGTTAALYSVTFSGSTVYPLTYTSSLTGTSPTITIARTGTDNRPTIPAASYDIAPIAAGTTTVIPLGTDPPLSGAASGVSTVYTNYDGFAYMAKPDPLAATTAAAFGSTGPLNTNNPAVVVNATEGGTKNQPAAPLNVGYQGHAGDALGLYVRQVGSGTAGSDVMVAAFLIQR